MATTARRPGVGTFESEYDDLGLYTLVRVVAEFVSPDDPTSVSQAAWDAGRAPSGHPDAPSARAICTRLADKRGKSFPWRELLELVCDPSRDIAQTHAQRTGEEDADHLTEEHVYYALRRVADELEAKTFAPDTYARTRRQLIASDRRRGVDLLAELMPTVGQIERIMDSWDAGLELAGLEVRNGDGWKAPRGMPLIEALDLHAEATDGWLCSYQALEAFARAHDISLARQEKGKPWSSCVDEATQLRAARGAGTKGIAGPGTELTYRLPEGADRPAAPKRRRRDHWTLELCVDAVRRYFEQLPARQAASKKGYLAWSAGREDAPAPSVFDRYGGWAAVSKLARGSGPTPHVPTKAEKIEAAVLAYIDEHGQIRTRDVPALLGVGSHTASNVLKRLKDKGVIAVGSKHPTGRSVFYVRQQASRGQSQ
jgi:hypothetical protein